MAPTSVSFSSPTSAAQQVAIAGGTKPYTVAGCTGIAAGTIAAAVLTVTPQASGACSLVVTDAAGVRGGLALRSVEVGGDSDDGLGDFGAEEALCVAFKLQQDVGGDLGWGEGKAADVELEDLAGLKAFGEMEGKEFELWLDVSEGTAHEALDGVDGIG